MNRKKLQMSQDENTLGNQGGEDHNLAQNKESQKDEGVKKEQGVDQDNEVSATDTPTTNLDASESSTTDTAPENVDDPEEEFETPKAVKSISDETVSEDAGISEQSPISQVSSETPKTDTQPTVEETSSEIASSQPQSEVSDEETSDTANEAEDTPQQTSDTANEVEDTPQQTSDAANEAEDTSDESDEVVSEPAQNEIAEAAQDQSEEAEETPAQTPQQKLPVEPVPSETKHDTQESSAQNETAETAAPESSSQQPQATSTEQTDNNDISVQSTHSASSDTESTNVPVERKPMENTTAPKNTEEKDQEVIAKLQKAYTTLKSEIGKVIVGQERVIDEVLISIFSRGHCLLVGVPGLAKTKLISTLAQALSLSFSRIQFTPDLMPSDITGTEVIQEDKLSGQRQFKFLQGPIFANVVLADEINRTPPKTQAALLEAMQEHQVTAGGRKHTLPQPFFVLATQNPIEQEGTYPLPEAQLDRFMFNTLVEYPTEAEELQIMKMTTTGSDAEISQVVSTEDIIELQKIVRRVPIGDHQIQYAMSFARMTRVTTPEAPDFIKNWLSWGAGPRASQYLIIGAKARAILRGRNYVSTEDIRAVAHPVLRHRIITNYSASAEGITPDKVIDKLIEIIPDKAAEDGRLSEVLKS